SGLAEVDARLGNGVFFGDLVVKVEAVMDRSSPIFRSGKGVSIEKSTGGVSSHSLVMLEKLVKLFYGYKISFYGTNCSGPMDGVIDCAIFGLNRLRW
ncbi:hypothetical protein Tco_0305974, partial [Tanacetum coccineum]